MLRLLNSQKKGGLRSFNCLPSRFPSFGFATSAFNKSVSDWELTFSVHFHIRSFFGSEAAVVFPHFQQLSLLPHSFLVQSHSRYFSFFLPTLSRRS
jgi:hypothetical protein